MIPHTLGMQFSGSLLQVGFENGCGPWLGEVEISISFGSECILGGRAGGRLCCTGEPIALLLHFLASQTQQAMHSRQAPGSLKTRRWVCGSCYLYQAVGGELVKAKCRMAWH